MIERPIRRHHGAQLIEGKVLKPAVDLEDRPNIALAALATLFDRFGG